MNFTTFWLLSEAQNTVQFKAAAFCLACVHESRARVHVTGRKRTISVIRLNVSAGLLQLHRPQGRYKVALRLVFVFRALSANRRDSLGFSVQTMLKTKSSGTNTGGVGRICVRPAS